MLSCYVLNDFQTHLYKRRRKHERAVVVVAVAGRHLYVQVVRCNYQRARPQTCALHRLALTTDVAI